MKIKCEFCGNFINDTDEICPSCNAANEHLVRAGSGVPKTIGELSSFCVAKGLPLEKMRFFIGSDCKEARAFGIFKDENGNFVVYKNKTDGSRMVRYSGKDEAYAVNEIYQKLRNEVVDRKESGKLLPTNKNNKKTPPRSSKPNDSQPARVVDYNGRAIPKRYYHSPKKKTDLKSIIILVCIFILVAMLFISCASCIATTPDAGYYKYKGSDYYNDYSIWYRYDVGSSSWIEEGDCPSDLYDNYNSYYFAPADDSSKRRDGSYTGSAASSYDSYSSESYPLYGQHNYSSSSSDSDSSWWDWSSSSDDDSWSSSNSWDSDWDDDDWDFDFSGWDSSDTNWDSDW